MNQSIPGKKNEEHTGDSSSLRTDPPIPLQLRTEEGIQRKRDDRQIAITTVCLVIGFVLASYLLYLSVTETHFFKSTDNGPPKTYQVNLNSATHDQLCAIPGVGPKTADRILKKRKQLGNYESIQQLQEVKGIGKKTVDRIKRYLTLEDE